MDAPDLPVDCQNLVRDLSLYLDGELSPRRRAEIEQHLATCANCHAVVDTVRKTIQLYQDLPQPKLSPAARERLYRALALNEFLPPTK
jgi:anti-sigma factor RsiW